MPYDRDVQAFDERAASYESGRRGQLHKEISDRVGSASVPVSSRRVAPSC